LLLALLQLFGRLFLGLEILFFSGVIASSPYNNLNGVKFLDLDTVVFCA
jgi:hypothetical protein